MVRSSKEAASVEPGDRLPADGEPSPTYSRPSAGVPERRGVVRDSGDRPGTGDDEPHVRQRPGARGTDAAQRQPGAADRARYSGPDGEPDGLDRVRQVPRPDERSPSAIRAAPAQVGASRRVRGEDHIAAVPSRDAHETCDRFGHVYSPERRSNRGFREATHRDSIESMVRGLLPPQQRDPFDTINGEVAARCLRITGDHRAVPRRSTRHWAPGRGAWPCRDGRRPRWQAPVVDARCRASRRAHGHAAPAFRRPGIGR